MLHQIVKDISLDALELVFEDAMKRGNFEDAKIISDEIFERKLARW